MAIVTSEKIFVDPKEEITTVVERAISSDKERIIFVIPQNSLLLSSAVTVNILFRELAKSKKIPVIVTEDDYGRIISKRSGFEVVAKVSLITSELWEASKSNKRRFLEKQQLKKKSLLENVQGEEQGGGEPTTEIPEEVQTENATPEILKEEEQTLKDADQSSTILEEAKVQETSEKAKELADDERLLKRYQKPRREAKIINLGGIEVFSGGNIKNLQEQPGDAKIDSNADTEINSVDNMEDFNTPTRRISSFKKASNFTGKDFTRIVNKENSITNFFKNLFTIRKVKDPSERLDPLNQTNKLKKRLPIIILCLVLFLFLSGGYVLAFVVSSVDITLKLKKEDVAASAFIQVDPDLKEAQINPATPDAIVIPGLEIKLDKLSISKTGEASGQGKRGVKAKGVVTIYNKTLSPVTIKAGTLITSVTTNLKYTIVKDVSIKAAVKKPDNSIDTSDAKADDVPVEAADVGPEYNITESSSNTTFLADGFTSTNLTVTRYLPIDGGSVENFVSVSKDNIDTVKKAILPDLESQAKTKLKSEVPQGYRLIDESIVFTETASTTIPAQDQESKDKTFSLTIEGTIQGIAIKNKDLEDAVTSIIENNKSTDNSIKQIEGIANIDITKVEKGDGKKLVLTISSKGSVSSKITDEQIKKDIAGKTIDEARDYLNLIEQIESFKITFNPTVIPSGLQRVPTEQSRINIKTK